MTKPVWTTACLDWQDRIREGRSLIPPPLFPEQAEQAVAIYRELKIVDAIGSPTFGEAGAPWMEDIIRSVFGAYDANSGRRLIQEWLIMVPKKSGKSGLGAAIMLVALILNWRASAELAIIAPTVEVSSNAFSPCRDMVQKDDELSALCQVQTHIKTVTHRTSGATLKVLAAETNTLGGKKNSFTLVDELHLFGSMPQAEQMFREALGGMASRPESFVIWISTQSSQPPAGIWKTKLDYARAVRDGRIVDPAFMPILWEHPDDMVADGSCLLLENMPLVHPNLGYSVDPAFLEREYHKAKHTSEESFRDYMSKFANVQIGMNLRSDSWPGADYWQSCTDPKPFTLARLLAECEVVDIGIDGGGLSDLLGLAVIGRIKGTQKWMHWSHAWAHPSVMERNKQVASRLQDFAKDGDLTMVERIGQDVEGVADICAQVYSSGLLDRIGVDPAGIGAILEALEANDIPSDKIIGISQGWKLTSSIKTTERKLAEGALIHGGSALMAWCCGNAKVEPRGNAITITKGGSGSAKIDTLMATFNAVSLMALNPQSAGEAYQMFVL
jgi:phage terminase large subunit-like protein